MGFTADLRTILRKHMVHRGAPHLVSASATLDTPAREERTLQIAMDVTKGNELLRNYRDKLLIAPASELLFASVAGMWVAPPRFRRSPSKDLPAAGGAGVAYNPGGPLVPIVETVSAGATRSPQGGIESSGDRGIDLAG
jgi:hypothetical protein